MIGDLKDLYWRVRGVVAEWRCDRKYTQRMGKEPPSPLSDEMMALLSGPVDLMFGPSCEPPETLADVLRLDSPFDDSVVEWVDLYPQEDKRTTHSSS